MRAIIALLLVSSVLSQGFLAPQVQDTKQNVKDFATGFFLAVGVLEQVPDLLDCVTSASSAQKNIEDALAKLSSGNFNDIIDGIESLVKIISTLTKSCGDASKETVAYINFLEGVFTDHFAKTAITNITKNLNVVIGDAKAIATTPDWILKGAYAGDIAKIILTGEPNEQ